MAWHAAEILQQKEKFPGTFIKGQNFNQRTSRKEKAGGGKEESPE
jgi:hypothetical protein